MFDKAAAKRASVTCALAAILTFSLALSGCDTLGELPFGGSGESASAASEGSSAPKRASLTKSAQPFDEAVLAAANDLFAQLPPADGGDRRVLAIDPLIDGLTGGQSLATQSMQSQIVDLVEDRYPNLQVEEFSTNTIAQSPLVLLGSLTAADAPESPQGSPEAYRVWLALADLATGKIVSNATVFTDTAGVDGTPTAFFRDSPGWSQDRSVEAYLRTCGSKAGDDIDPVYLDGILAAALVSDAMAAYDEGRYQEALDLYESAARTPGGDQLRVHNGLYLANWKLGRTQEAEGAFTNLVDYGLANQSLAVKFLFQSGSTVFWQDPAISGPYGMWIGTVAQESAAQEACLDVVGHASPTGPAPMNDRLSLLRAQYVQAQLVDDAPVLAPRTTARGVGSRETIVGTGTEDAADALDRRVEFDVRGC